MSSPSPTTTVDRGTTATVPSSRAGTTHPAPVTHSSHDHARRWWLLAVIGVAQLMVVLDMTIVNIALPTAQSDLGFADSQRQWIVTAYALSFGSLLLLGGRLGDVFGRKWMFLGGLVGFAAASVVGGLAQSFAVLVIARVLQGVFAAALAPSALALLATAFAHDPKERAKAFGIFGAVAGGGGGLGLVLGGVLTEFASWRWCFFVNIVFAAVAVAGGLLLLHGNRDTQRPRVDVVGAVLATGGLFAVVFGLSRAETAGWADGLTLASFAAALVLLVAFVLVERKVGTPLLPLHIVRDRNRGMAYLSVAILSIATFSIFLFLTFFMQLVLGYSPLATGFAFLPMILTTLAVSVIANIRLLPRFGAKRLVILGMVLGAAGMFWLSTISPDATYAVHVLPALIFVGLGFALILAPSMQTATLGVQRSETGIASAMVNTMQQVGGAVGTALLSTIAASATTSYLTSHPSRGAAIAGAVHGYSVAFLVSACVFVAGAILASVLFTRPTSPTGALAAGARSADAPAAAH